MTSETDFDVYVLWHEIENDGSLDNLQRAHNELVAKTEGRKMSERETQVFYYLNAKIKK
jgi:hypothetical protein